MVFTHPLKGPDGEALATTLAEVGPPEAPRSLMVVSGTHGIEGYAGGGIMCHGILRPIVFYYVIYESLHSVVLLEVRQFAEFD